MSDKYRSLGCLVFLLTIFTFGLLGLFTGPLTIYMVVMSSRRCPACRAERRAAKRAARLAQNR